jgi:hypothetical protein
MTSIFDEPAFVALMTAAEMLCAASFNAAMSIPKIPVVRLTCKEAGFRNFATALEFKTDAIFRLFKKWLHFWLLQDIGPNYGCVIGDTWADFKRHYGRNVGHDIFFVVDATGCDEPVTGTLHLGGIRSKAFLSVDSIANLRKLALIQDNCMRVNMDILLFSLSFIYIGRASAQDGLSRAWFNTANNHRALPESPRLLTLPLATPAAPLLFSL